MRRVTVFLLLLITSLAALVVLIVAGFYVFSASPSSNWMSDMWGHMSGMMGTAEVPVQNPALPYFSVMFVVIVGIVIVSVGGLAYFLMFPEIKTINQAKSGEQVSSQNPTAYEVIMKTLTDEERKVVKVLTTHDGRYLQKYIRKEAGLSRLKTHRILSRLADRGIVSLKKSGNTNEVQLLDWLRS